MKMLLSFVLALIVLIAGAAVLWLVSEWIFTQNARLVSMTFGMEPLSFGSRMVQIFLLLAEVCALVFVMGFFLIRYRKPRVFISFKHLHEEKAKALARQLEKDGLEVLRLPFGQYGHDQIVEFVREALRKADALVAIPDAEQASFVDAELMAASVRRIPIALLQYQERQFQPTTLLRGYPVFDYECLRECQFEPLRRYLWFAAKHPREYWRITGRIFKVFMDGINWLVFGIMLSVYALLEGIMQLLNMLTQRFLEFTLFQPDADSAIFFNTVMILLMLGYAIFLLYSQFRTLAVARQLASTGTESFQTFSEAFSILESDRKILNCIRENNFIPRGK